MVGLFYGGGGEMDLNWVDHLSLSSSSSSSSSSSLSSSSFIS
jgi:hypothetical protein